MLRRVAALTFLLALAPAVLFRQAPVSAVAQPAPATGVDVVRAAYDDLLDRFFRVPQPIDLLQAGWKALQQKQPSAPPLESLPDDRSAAFATFAQRFAQVSGASGSQNEVEAAYAVVDGMAQSLHDQHTQFLRPELYQSVLAELGGDKPTGPGIHLAPRFPLIVSAVAPGGPAERAGVLPGDQIDTVDGKPIVRLTTDELVRALVASPAGTTVTYGIARDGAPLSLMITSGPYYFPVLDSRLLPDGTGYLHLDQFADGYAPLPDGTSLLREFDRRLDELDGLGANGLILDLRSDPGGSEETALELLGRFLPEGTPAAIQRDERGHEITTIVAGRMRAKQLPMVVLANHGSASASELTASTLREAQRAIVVGDRTAGALTSSNILPLPGGAGLQVAAADVLTGYKRFRIDGTGFPVDVAAPDPRTQADFRAGRDPQLAAAMRAISRAPDPPPAAPTAVAGLATDELARLLEPYTPTASQAPTNERLTRVVDAGSADLNQPNEGVGLGSRDPAALLARIRSRGWLGRHSQEYAATGKLPPYLSVSVDLYDTPAGAADALGSNDHPDTEVLVPAPIALGDQTVAYRGAWFDAGGSAIVWRRGAVVFAVSYSDPIGPEHVDTLVAMARVVDASYRRNPIQAGAMDAEAPATSRFPTYQPHIIRDAAAGAEAVVLAVVAVAAGALGTLAAPFV